MGVGFTKKRTNQIKKTSYAQTQQVKNIRRKMVEIISKEVSSADLKETVNKLIPDSIGKDIEKAWQSIYPLYDVFVNQVKVLKRPRFDLGKLWSCTARARAPLPWRRPRVRSCPDPKAT